jgi:hypothetical protein
MLKEYRLQSILGIWGGLLLFALGFIVTGKHEAGYIFFGNAIMSASFALFICGCFMYARGKGRSWYWGILGLIGPLGLVALYCLMDKSKFILKKRQKETS